MAVRCRLGVAVITHDEEWLGRAVQSLINQREEVHRVYIVDNATTAEGAVAVLAQAQRKLRESGIDYCVIRREDRHVARARARVCHQVREDKDLELVTFLDADDELGVGALRAFREAYVSMNGEVDVLVPRRIVRTYDSGRPDELQELVIPPSLEHGHLTPQRVEPWRTLTSVGATFAIRVGALARFNGFSKKRRDDEWVDLYCSWSARGARFAYAEVTGEGLYCYWQHDTRTADQHADRRQLHGTTRPQTALRAAVRARQAVGGGYTPLA